MSIDTRRAQKRQELENHWQQLQDLLSALRQQHTLETRVEEKFRLNNLIQRSETEQDEVEQKLDALEHRDDKVLSNPAVASNSVVFDQLAQQVTTQYNVAGDLHIMNDNSNRSVSVSGSNVGVISTGDNAQIHIGTQNIGNLPNASDDTKVQIEALVTQLNQLLQNVPAESQTDAKDVSAMTGELLEKAEQQSSERQLKVTGSGLIEAAEAVAKTTPKVIDVVKNIVKLVAPGVLG